VFVTSRKRTTHKPEQPPFHLLYRDKIPSEKNKARNEECTQAEGGVIRKKVTECPEKTLNGQKRHVIEKMEGPESIRRAMKICHKIDNDIVEQNPNSREGKI
jgi:hypothetical protein